MCIRDRFKDGKAPVQLLITQCSSFQGEGFDPFLKSQMWDCVEQRDQILKDCQYQVVATDMLAGALPALERADLDMDFLDALAELYPGCEAFYFQNCGKLIPAEAVRSHHIAGPDRFIRFGINVRFFNIEGTEDMLVDTVGMSTLFLPDLQYHFHGMDPNWVVNHAYNPVSYTHLLPPLLFEVGLTRQNGLFDGIHLAALHFGNEKFAGLHTHQAAVAAVLNQIIG